MKIGPTRLTSLCALALTSSLALGQPLPEEAKRGCTFEAPVTHVEHITPQDRDYYWRDTEMDAHGVVLVKVPEPLLNVVGDLQKHSNADEAPPPGFSDSRLKYRGVLVESNDRTTFFFESKSGKVMLTRWEFAHAGARLCLFDEFAGVTILGRKAHLSLARALSSSRVLWKALWLSNAETVQFELYVEDRLDDGQQPTFSPSDILSFAAALDAASR